MNENLKQADERFARRAKGMIKTRVVSAYELLVLQMYVDNYESNEPVEYTLEYELFTILTNSRIPYKNGSLT